MNLKLLRKRVPFQWMIREYIPGKSEALCFPFIQRKDVLKILDSIGIENWQCEFYCLEKMLFCRIGIKTGESWVWKSSSGEGFNGAKGKAEETDAFKRAASMWGIGVFLNDVEPYIVKTHGNYTIGNVLPPVINDKLEPVEDLSAYINDLIADKESLDFGNLKRFLIEAKAFSVLNFIKSREIPLTPDEQVSLEILNSPHEYSDIETVIEPIRQRLLKG